VITIHTTILHYTTLRYLVKLKYVKSITVRWIYEQEFGA